MKRSKIAWVGLAILALMGYEGKAQNGYQYFNLAGGYYFVPNRSLTGTISLEFAGKNRQRFEYAAEVYQNKKADHKNYTLNVIYKPMLSKQKNTSLYFRFGAGVGTNEQKFVAPLQIGFEFSQAFGNGWEIMLQQKNYFIFWDAQKWRTGLSLGVKIPII